MELRTKGLREGLSGMSGIGPGYKSPGKSTKRYDDLANERSSSSKMDLVERPFMGSLGVDVRDNSNPQYRRNNDPGFGRGHGYSWIGVPNWTLLVPNGFAPFHHGPTHGGFQATTPMFPSHALFGVRPPMEFNHASIPYHIPNLDRFSGHMHPLGWQNMVEGTLPSRFHGWDGNNCVFKDNWHVYGSSDWDWNRHLSNSRGLDSGPEISKDQNGHLKRDSSSPTCKDASVPFQVDGASTEPASHMSQDDSNWGDVPEKIPRTKLTSFESSGKVPMSYSPKTMPEKTSGMLTPSDNSFLSQHYLSKLDISVELALPELYDQCMSLLDVEKNASIDSEASTGFFKHGSRSQQRYAATLSPFPADSSLFQRAIEHYKEERVEMPKWGKVDVNLATNRKQLDEPVSSSSLVNMQVAVSTGDALTNMPISTLHLNKEETLSPPAEEHLEELHQNLCRRGQDHVCAHPVNQESLATSLGKEDEFTSEWVITRDMEGKDNTVVINESKLESKMPTSDDFVNTKDKITGFAHYAEE
ncbi:hypothetical protein QN277_015529 [Acacia crassicarpa]|nr:hypothetical protein QN277_015529 [Acacia crassicarpa]